MCLRGYIEGKHYGTYDLLLTNGMVVTGGRMRRADVGVRGETIAAVGPDLPREGAARSSTSTGKYIFPGIIDVHVHPVYLDDVEAASRVAAYGGTTTLLHFAYGRTGESLCRRSRRCWRTRPPGRCWTSGCTAACSMRPGRCRRSRR